MTLPSTTIDFAFVMETVAYGQGITARVEGITDQCYGLLLSADTTFGRFCAAERDLWNFQVVDGNPIRLVRRPINADFTSDFVLYQKDCISRAGTPSVLFTRVDQALLPGQIEVQYIDPERLYDITTQYAKHLGSPCTNNRMSVQTSFVITGSQAKQMGFDLLYRIWSQQLSVRFEHPDLTIEPADTIDLATSQGEFSVLVQTATITRDRTNIIQGTIILSSAGFNVDINGNPLTGVLHFPGAGTVGGAPTIGGTTTSGGPLTLPPGPIIPPPPGETGSGGFDGRGGLSVTVNVLTSGQIDAFANLSGNGRLTVDATIGGGRTAAATFGGRGGLVVRLTGPIYATPTTFGGTGGLYVSGGAQSISATFKGTGHL